MQSDNAPNLTAEVSIEFMKASQVTKVTSTAGHPRTQGLVVRQNRTLLTLLRVFCSRRMRDWDQHLDEVLGAYNSTYSPQQIHTQPHPEAIIDPSAPDLLSDVSMLSGIPQLFSDHEAMRSPSPHISQSSKTPMGTSAPLLTQPSLTDYLSNYPLWPGRDKNSTAPSSRPSSPSGSIPSVKSPQPPPTAPSIKRGRGRPRKKTHQQKAKGKTVPKVRKSKPNTQTESQNRYQLRHRRQPRYKCGTCGLRDCVCVLAVNEKQDVPTGARGVPQEGRQHTELVHRIVVLAEKTLSGVERTEKYPVETILQQIAAPGVAKAPCPRFKEWTSDGKGLEFTLATVVPLWYLCVCHCVRTI